MRVRVTITISIYAINTMRGEVVRFCYVVITFSIYIINTSDAKPPSVQPGCDYL